MRKTTYIIPTILLLAVYLVSYIGIGVHECSSECTKEVVSILGHECCHPHHEHCDEHCHGDGQCHHTEGCCHTKVYSISEANEGFGTGEFHNYLPESIAFISTNVAQCEANLFKSYSVTGYSFPLVTHSFKKQTILRL